MNSTAVYIQANVYDPTRTTSLRNAWTRDMLKRFRELERAIRKTIVDEDCFGLTIMIQQASTPGRRAVFAFPRTQDKVEGFMQWLRREEEKGLLEIQQFTRIGTSANAAWTNKYVYDSYKRGVIRARYELNKAGYTVPSIEASGGIEAILSSPFHVDRVGMLYTRAFEELKGVTAQMDTQISRILGQGLVDGDNPNLLARKLLATINGKGMGELGITDSLGRFIPAERRARMIAHTETIRAHHAANIQEYRNWQVEGVSVEAEFVTAGDDHVCTECAGYHGNRYTLKEVEYMIPVHPFCRCCVIPVRKVSAEEKAIKEPKPSTPVRKKPVSKPASSFGPFSEGAKKWERMDDLNALQTQFRDKFRIINFNGLTSKHVKRLNAIGEDLSYMTSKFDRFRIKASNASNEGVLKGVYFDKTNMPLGSKNPLAAANYWEDVSHIHVGLNCATSVHAELTIGVGSQSVSGSSFRGVFRHEFGHHVWEKFLTRRERSEWLTFHNNLVYKNRLNEISRYAATNEKEAFAESFSAYMSPSYIRNTMGMGVRGYSLPKDIEMLLDKFFK